jgi:hypothetical protein
MMAQSGDRTGVLRNMDDPQKVCRGRYIAAKSSPRFIWLFRLASQSPGYVVSFKSGMLQTVWHPDKPSILLVTTSRPIPVV